jgi:isoprenylcysteine carboxyl methyltransferase (ICMT) family protein YpbQ
MSIGFESIGLLGLTSAERTKVIAQLALLLMLAARVAVEERDDER